MLIYVDESGNMGRKGGRYFTISFFVIPDRKNKNRLKNIVKKFNTKNKTKEIKGYKLTVPKRQYILNKINKKNDYFISYICLDKNKINNQNLFDNQSIFFNYLFQFVFQKIAVDYSNNKKILGDIEILIDERNIKIDKGKYLEDYIKTKLFEWDISFKDIKINYYDSKNVKLIQLADMTAGIINHRYKTGKKHEYNFLKIKHKIRFPQNGFKVID